jgi:predicted nucleic acid-binding protein
VRTSETLCRRALLQDIDAGLLTTLENSVRGETLDNFLEHAEWYLTKSRPKEAGVISGVVFEDTIRRIHRDKVGDDKGQKLEEIINTLTKKGVITGEQSKQAKVGSHVRTKATHAQWDEFILQGVMSTIQITKTFLREHLSGSSAT